MNVLIFLKWLRLIYQHIYQLISPLHWILAVGFCSERLRDAWTVRRTRRGWYQPLSLTTVVSVVCSAQQKRSEIHFTLPDIQLFSSYCKEPRISIRIRWRAKKVKKKSEYWTYIHQTFNECQWILMCLLNVSLWLWSDTLISVRVVELRIQSGNSRTLVQTCLSSKRRDK